MSGGGLPASPISSPPPPYSPNPHLSPRSLHSPSLSPAPFTPPHQSSTPPPPRQENSALIKSLLANKVVAGPSGGLAGMLAAPITSVIPTTSNMSLSHATTHRNHTPPSLPPPPPYPHHSPLPSMQVPAILKESPPPPIPHGARQSPTPLPCSTHPATPPVASPSCSGSTPQQQVTLHSPSYVTRLKVFYYYRPHYLNKPIKYSDFNNIGGATYRSLFTIVCIINSLTTNIIYLKVEMAFVVLRVHCSTNGSLAVYCT